MTARADVIELDHVRAPRRQDRSQHQLRMVGNRAKDGPPRRANAMDGNAVDRLEGGSVMTGMEIDDGDVVAPRSELTKLRQSLKLASTHAGGERAQYEEPHGWDVSRTWFSRAMPLTI
jgi:hypothetical protein